MTTVKITRLPRPVVALAFVGCQGDGCDRRARFDVDGLSLCALHAGRAVLRSMLEDDGGGDAPRDLDREPREGD